VIYAPHIAFPTRRYAGTVQGEPRRLGDSWTVRLVDMDPAYRDGQRSHVNAAFCDNLFPFDDAAHAPLIDIRAEGVNPYSRAGDPLSRLPASGPLNLEADDNQPIADWLTSKRKHETAVGRLFGEDRTFPAAPEVSEVDALRARVAELEQDVALQVEASDLTARLAEGAEGTFRRNLSAALGWVRILATGYDHEGERECSHCHAPVSDGCDDDCALAAYLKANPETLAR
jgi:hypothetical protein